jgi:hypothetical protein
MHALLMIVTLVVKSSLRAVPKLQSQQRERRETRRARTNLGARSEGRSGRGQRDIQDCGPTVVVGFVRIQ